MKAKEHLYSTNNQLSFYKSALVNTKCVDNEAPFVHSNNYRSFTLKNVRPMQNKIYKASIKN